jgi:hypothetical protein
MADNRCASGPSLTSHEAIVSVGCCACGVSSDFGGPGIALRRKPDAIGGESLDTNGNVKRRQT